MVLRQTGKVKRFIVARQAYITKENRINLEKMQHNTSKTVKTQN
jgi:hypothetical protein